ncbi:MAG: short-chain dehydrogenase [Chloroflexi bacterium]|nr:short-chain dehydrogenase [Chloroflexota bacterium]|tara:strand:+ start:2067 stop:2831 length:765 start_codon:yes stop_codon:yes gene_type:complete
MDLLLNQASAIVSGGTKGIGLAIVNNFLKEGMNVTTFSRNKKNIDSTKRKFNSFSSQINILEANILDEDNCKKIIASHIKKFKTLDILVNNAGESIKNGTTKDKWGQSFDINVTAHVILSELVIPHLEKSKIGGNIVNISSIFGRESGGNPQYNASKAAMISFSKSYANLLIKKGIRVNTIAPGSIRFTGGTWDKRVKNEPKEMRNFIQQNLPAGRFGTANEIADVVTFVCSPKASWIVGSAINVDGGQSRSNI